MSNISIIVDSLDDVFDDFDPRPLDKKMLSRDFVDQLKARYLENPSTKEIHIIIPKKFRDRVKTKLVVKRIKQYFKRRELRKYKTITSIKRQGCLFFLIGLLLCLVAIFLPEFLKINGTFQSLTEILYIPGWFGMWEGFGKIFDFPKELRDDEEIYWALAELVYKFEYMEE